MIFRVGYEDIIVAIDGERDGAPEFGVDSRAAVAVAAFFARIKTNLFAIVSSLFERKNPLYSFAGA